MKYHEAADIARKNPGAVLSRDASGTFIVRLSNGTMVGSSGNAADVVDAVHKEREEPLDTSWREKTDREDQLRHEIADLKQTIARFESAVPKKREEPPVTSGREQTDFAIREDQLRHEIADLNQTITRLNGSAHAARLDADQFSQQLTTLQSENTSLQTTLAKVSASELERIKQADRVIRETTFARRKAERSTVKCACRGEVEKCSRCFGAGEYVVDGFGNSA